MSILTCPRMTKHNGHLGFGHNMFYIFLFGTEIICPSYPLSDQISFFENGFQNWRWATKGILCQQSGPNPPATWDFFNTRTRPIQQAKVFSKTCKKYSMYLTTWLITPILMMNKSIVNTPIQIVTPKDILYFVIPGHLTKND